MNRDLYKRERGYVMIWGKSVSGRGNGAGSEWMGGQVGGQMQEQRAWSTRPMVRMDLDFIPSKRGSHWYSKGGEEIRLMFSKDHCGFDVEN